MSAGLQIIGAGFGRTGTLSLKVALEQLGFGPCYHMIEFLKDPSRVGHWENAQARRPVDWEALFEGFSAAVDFPVSLYYEQLIEVFPDAKVVLTTRDVESWYASASQTIMALSPTPWQVVSILVRLPFSSRARFMARVGRHNARMMRAVGTGQEAKRNYLAHIDRVRQVVPRDRLLEFSVKDGWAPLCAFIGVDPPDTPFPRVNDRAGFKDMVKPLLK